MRIIAVGIGGAGSRIVDSLYGMDRKSSKVACVQGIAIDVDEGSMKRLSGLPENARMCFSPLEAGLPGFTQSEGQGAPIDITEIVSRIQNLESGENDAIVLCCGLGGGMTDVAPHIIAGLRSSVVEPIFGLVTLPCLAEGERISAKAADDIEMLSSLLDGIIVFDNETWYRKIKAQKAHIPVKEKGFAEKIGLKRSEKPLPPEQATYHLLNEAIVRRISLILRAGEFKADGGIDLAEVVLDSGEVLNTMKGMGFITIGYAVEKLPHDPLRFLSRIKPAGLFDEEQKRKASRIVELTKQAIYHEISTPCDLTSAHKALVLVAGPSHELSMKGFMTVRKWIDRSIAGLETRSGDYPVMNTKNVAIIVMLSGLENIPRIAELKEIRSQSKPKIPTETEDEYTPGTEKVHKVLRDDMITLPARKIHDDESGRRARGPAETELRTAGISQETHPDLEEGEPEPAPDRVKPVLPEVVPKVPPQDPSRIREIHDDRNRREPLPMSQRRVIVSPEGEPDIPPVSPEVPPARPTGIGHLYRKQPVRHQETAEDFPGAQETERQRIERELRRQRSAAIGGHPSGIAPPSERNAPAGPEVRIIKRSRLEKTVAESPPEIPPESKSGEKRTVIVGKRRITAIPQESAGIPDADAVSPAIRNTDPATEIPGEHAGVEIRDRVFRAKDGIFEGKGVRKPPVPPARDSILMHTELRPKKKLSGPEDSVPVDARGDAGGKDSGPVKKQTRSGDQDRDESRK